MFFLTWKYPTFLNNGKISLQTIKYSLRDIFLYRKLDRQNTDP